ncbi:hypothetical protein [Streptomyces sp. NPDC051173]|uniref:hypothetical protein n=1 Tax=Streptomyces sp. NPDC051173 TaxID=3155164 RepID=UPI00344DCFEE
MTVRDLVATIAAGGGQLAIALQALLPRSAKDGAGDGRPHVTYVRRARPGTETDQLTRHAARCAALWRRP